MTARVIVGTKISEHARDMIDLAAGRAGVGRSEWMRAALAYALVSMPRDYPSRLKKAQAGV